MIPIFFGIGGVFGTGGVFGIGGVFVIGVGVCVWLGGVGFRLSKAPRRAASSSPRRSRVGGSLLFRGIYSDDDGSFE